MNNCKYIVARLWLEGEWQKSLEYGYAVIAMAPEDFSRFEVINDMWDMARTADDDIVSINVWHPFITVTHRTLVRLVGKELAHGVELEDRFEEVDLDLIGSFSTGKCEACQVEIGKGSAVWRCYADAGVLVSVEVDLDELRTIQ